MQSFTDLKTQINSSMFMQPLYNQENKAIKNSFITAAYIVPHKNVFDKLPNPRTR